MRGTDPRTSRMRSERSTIRATSPLKKRGANAISKLSSVNAIVEQSFLLHIVVKLPLSMRVINPSVSHMPIACPFGCHASLVGPNGAVFVRGMSLIHLSVEQCFLRRLCEVNFGGSGRQSVSQQALYCFRCLLFHIGLTNPCLLFVWRNSFPYFLSRFPGSSAKLEMRGIDPRTSRMQSERSAIWATSSLRQQGANDIWNLSSVNTKIERSLLLHIVLKSALSMRVINLCVSHMPVVCPPDWNASLVGSKGAGFVRRLSLIHLSVECCFLRRLSEVNLGDSGHQSVFQQALYCFRCFLLHIGLTNPCLLLVWQNSFPYFLFRFPGSSAKLEMRGIDPRTSRMQNERSTIWATSPLKNRGANAISNLSSVNAIVEQSFLLHIVVKLPLSMRVINPSVSHMPIACPFGCHASLVGPNRAVFVRGMSLIHLSVEQCFLRRLCEVNLGGSGRQLVSQQALYCFRCFFLHIGRTNPSLLLV